MINLIFPDYIHPFRFSKQMVEQVPKLRESIKESSMTDLKVRFWDWEKRFEERFLVCRRISSRTFASTRPRWERSLCDTQQSSWSWIFLGQCLQTPSPTLSQILSQVTIYLRKLFLLRDLNSKPISDRIWPLAIYVKEKLEFIYL